MRRLLFALLILALLSGCVRSNDLRLDMPALEDGDYYWIAARIFQNETGSNIDYLTHWNEGEDFPSMGIGHFIWFPEGVDAPFDESFPRMLSYVREHADECSPVPEWLQGPGVPAAPWGDKASFDAALEGEPRLATLRDWLARTAPQQAQYIVASFGERWDALQLDDGDKAVLTALLQRLLATPQGQFAVIDYFNFKGLGSNPRERYAGEGWGLVQVLREIAALGEVQDSELVSRFGEAAADRLALRVANSATERNEQRWLPGWHRRVAAYGASDHSNAPGAGSAYRVRPYLQSVAATSARITWFSGNESRGTVVVPQHDQLTVDVSPPRYACELAYYLAEFKDLDGAQFPPWQQTAELTGLEPGKSYSIEIDQDGEIAGLEVRTPDPETAHFVVYADSETEPESTGEHVRWIPPGDRTGGREYVVDQTEGYRANLEAIAAKQPDFIAIAGDLVESGGEQRDWDEFWRHNAVLASSIPIVPALGNHDYFGGPGDLGGFRSAGVTRALAKYERYFNRPRYYRHEHGPVSLIVIDANNGLPEKSATDTNWYLDGLAPEWQPGSPQWQWLEDELAQAQRDSAFTFVMFHGAPYTSGIHGRTPGTDAGENFSSGQPLRVLTPLFLRYGVDAVFNGHDEMYEHSVVEGTEEVHDGGETDHAVHFFTVGIGGDGLREPDKSVQNPHRVFLAHEDSPERWSDEGVLVEGGKHYGHLDVSVGRDESGSWQAQLVPVYVFPLMNEDGELMSFETRRYDDALTLVNTRVD